MNYKKLEKLQEDDQRVSYKVKADEKDLEKQKYALYLQSRGLFAEGKMERISYELFEEMTDSSGQLDLAAYYINRNEIIKALQEEFELSEDEVERLYLKAIGYNDTTPYAIFEMIKLPELRFDTLMDFLPDEGIDESQIPDITEEVSREIEFLKEQNVRLVPIDKYEDVRNMVNLTIKQITDDGEEEITTSNMDIMQLLGQTGVSIEKILGLGTDDSFEIGEVLQQRYEENYGPGKFEAVINQVYETEYPEIDDDFAAEVSEFDTLDELYQNLEEQKLQKHRRQLADQLYEEIYNSFIQSHTDLFPEPFDSFIDLPAEAYPNLFSYQKSVLNSPYLQPILKDEIVDNAIRINERLTRNFADYILSSEIGKDYEIDEENLKKEIQEELIQASQEAGIPPINIEERVELLLPHYKAQSALVDYIENNN